MLDTKLKTVRHKVQLGLPGCVARLPSAPSGTLSKMSHRANPPRLYRYFRRLCAGCNYLPIKDVLEAR